MHLHDLDSPARTALLPFAGLLLLAQVMHASALQASAASPPVQSQPEAAQQSTPTSAPQPPANPPQDSIRQPAAPAASEPQSAASGIKPAAENNEAQRGITEEELRKMLVGKPLFVRGGYLFDNLSYNERGVLIGRVPEASYTLCGIQIDRVRLTRHKVELVGARYGLHFLGSLAYEDPTTAVERLKITPKKKVVKITVDRELVVKPKKAKGEKRSKGTHEPKQAPAPAAIQNAGTPGGPAAISDADQAKAEIAAAPVVERPTDPKSVTTTTSPAHAAEVLRKALDNIFAQGIDDRMIAAMPEFWKLYYKAAAAKADYRAANPAVMSQDTVDQKAKLLTKFEPPSNQFAQDNGVAGMALYHVILGEGGKPEQIAVARPIGFGLDENAVEAIRNAKFEPAMKDGKPVPVLLDLVVEFRIYSKRTAVSSATGVSAEKSGSALPGPYSNQVP